MKNVQQLRDLLIEKIDECNNGTLNAEDANAISNLAGKVAMTLKLELMYAKARGTKPEIDFLEKT